MATALFHAGSLIGPAIAALGLSIIVNSYGWRVAFVIAAAVGFVWMAVWLIWFRQPEVARWLSPEERDLIMDTRDTGIASPSLDEPKLGLKALLRSKTIWAITFTHGWRGLPATGWPLFAGQASVAIRHPYHHLHVRQPMI